MSKLKDLQIYRVKNIVKIKNVYSNDKEIEYNFLGVGKFTEEEAEWIRRDLVALFDLGLILGRRREAARIRAKLGLEIE